MPKISEYPEATELNESADDVLLVNANGVTSKITKANLRGTLSASTHVDDLATRIAELEQAVTATGSALQASQQVYTPSAGNNIIDLALGTRIHVPSTVGVWSPVFTNVPSGGVEVIVSVDVTTDGHEMTVPNGAYHGTAPVTADWDAGETNVIRLTKLPYVDKWIAEWLHNGVTPDSDPTVTPPTLTAQYSTSSARTSPVTLHGATLPAGDVAVFFGPADNTDIESFRIFCNHTGGLPAVGAEGDSYVRTDSSPPYDLLGDVAGVAVMWDTTLDPTGNNRSAYDADGSTTFTIEATYIDGSTTSSTFTFNTGNTPIAADPTLAHTATAYANAASSTTVTVPDGVDRLVVIQAHYQCSPSPGDPEEMTALTLNGTAMTTITAATKTPAESQGLGIRTAYLAEASLSTGTLSLVPTFSSSPASYSSIIYHIFVLTNVASPALAGIYDYDNVSEATGSTQVCTLTSVPANSILLTTSAQNNITTAATVDIGTATSITEIATYPRQESRASWVMDSGASANETATWSTTGRAGSVLVSVDYAASGGGGEVTPIIPATPTISSVSNAAGDNRLTVTWGAATDAVSYELRHGTTNPPATSPTVATSPQLLTGLAASVVRYVQVRSVSSTGDRSAWSTASSGTPTGAVAPPPDFSGKFPVSFDHVDVMMGEGYGTPNFVDFWTQKGFVRVNPASTEYSLGDQCNNTQLDRAIGQWESRGAYATAFRDACGPRLISTNKLSIDPYGQRMNIGTDAARWAAAIVDMAKSGSTGTYNRDATWRTLGNSINRVYRGWNVWDIFFLSVSHESNGSWAYSYTGRNPGLIGQPSLTGASNAMFGAPMAQALRDCGATGDCSVVHKLAVDHIIEILWDINPQIIVGMTPSDGASSDITGTAASPLGSTWVRSSFPDAQIDFLCPTLYARGQNNVSYDGSGDVDDWTNYIRPEGWLEYAQEYTNEIYGCAFGLLELGGDFAIPGELTIGAGDSQTDNEMAAFFERVLEHELVEANYPNGLAFINHWNFLNWVGSNGDPGCSFNIFEGCWGRFPTNVLPTSTGKPSWSSRTTPYYPKTLAYMQSQFGVGP